MLFRLIAICFGVVAGLIAAEAGLRIVEKSRLGDRITPTTITDPLLGTKIAPNTRGHDANGFRNASVPRQAEVVVLGDSQTWGVNAHSGETWPSQLKSLSGLSVYNMAVGGYGPVHYLVLADQALGLSPRIVVVGLYFGNDLYDAYSWTYANDNFANLRNKQASVEFSHNTVQERANAYWHEEKAFHNSFGRSSPAGWTYWIRVHSAIGRLLNRAQLWPGADDVDHHIDREWARAYPDHGAVCEDPPIRTVFTTAYRLTALDLDEPRIAEGLRITSEILLQIKEKTDRANTKILVLLIPTKEMVYSSLMKRDGRADGSYTRLVDMEGRARTQVEKWCQDHNIEYVDALGDLTAATARKERLYPSTTESHPNAAGYNLLAAIVNRKLTKLGVTARSGS